MRFQSASRSFHSFLVATALLSTFENAYAQGLGDRGQLEGWMDGAINAHLEAYHSAGAVVSVVKDGELFFSKGYGYADIEGRVKVDPAKTLFRIASVSKIFVWTAVMQLVEEGQLDLQADVNTYLTDLKVPERFGAPVTMAHLMTHTSGFEEYPLGLFRLDEESMIPLEEILKRELPNRVRSAGQYASYSNHGTALAMYIVEEITGVPWMEYIQSRILEPLGMDQFTFEQPLPAGLVGDLSKGYRWRGAVFQEQKFEYVPMAPIGGASASAEAMAKFMIAHLQFGTLGENRILKEETARLMQSDLHRMAPGVNAMAHGFIDRSQNGQRIIGHDGATLWFHTQLALLPEHGIGIFISHNSETGSAAGARLIRQFMDEYFPEPDPVVIDAPSSFDERAAKYTGSYRASRYSYNTIFKVGALLNTITVRPSGDGALRLSSSGLARWIEVAPLTFRREFGHEMMQFVEDDRGQVSHLLFEGNSVMTYDKDGALDNPTLHSRIMMVSMGMFLFTLVVWPIGAVVRWRHGVLLGSQEVFPAAARVVSWSACLLFVILVVVVAQSMADPLVIIYGIPRALDFALYLPMVATVLVLIAIGYTVYVWWKGQGRVVSRVYYTALSLVFVAFLWMLSYWNVLGHQY